EILIKAESNKDFLNIEVSDTGVGISENNLSYIFDRFYKVETVRNSSNNNLGLGLSMVKSMVALHNGFIEIKSREGIGTSVFIRFPTNL
ncbi:MAG: HAMP domain-containing histidine kinase, partial [Silvanigrellaceae bacterium]|nr:HAMP domain-containing histidine kinase [Silvanigrellaceae bacterium]